MPGQGVVKQSLRQAGAAALFSLSVLTGCSGRVDPTCNTGYSLLSAEIYGSYPENYLFLDKNYSDRYTYTFIKSMPASRRLAEIYESRPGHMIGVRARICGKIRPVDLPLHGPGETVMIQSIVVDDTVDMTQIINTYLAQNGLVPPPANATSHPR